MHVEPSLPILPAETTHKIAASLESQGVELVIGSLVNGAGIALGKTVAPQRVPAFHKTGLGASPSWNVFTIDGGIAFTPSSGVVGDLRLRLDAEHLVTLPDHLAWGPVEMFTQDGEPAPGCARGTLRRVVERLAQQGLEALVGSEFEFILVSEDGTQPAIDPWVPYGLGSVSLASDFLRELMTVADSCGIPLEQLHAEYAPSQFEFSLSPASPLEAADRIVLARLITTRVAHKHGYRVSFSPFPFSGGGGNGAHEHFSLTQNDTPIFSGGSGPYGMTPTGESAVAGVLDLLPALSGIFAGSVVSGERLKPGSWAGAYSCWGYENREAAVRFLKGGRGNPKGANVEVKAIDPSSNPYLTLAGILGAAVRGIEQSLPLPEEVTVNPSELSDDERARSHAVLLPETQTEALDGLAASAEVTEILGPDVVEAAVATRRYEAEHYGDLSSEELIERFRFAWSA